MRRRKLAIAFLLIAVTAATVSAQEVQQCQPPENLRFHMTGAMTKRSFDNDSRYIVFQRNEQISFISSLQSAGTITWSFGDGGSDSKRSASGLFSQATHSFNVSGAYKVKLAAKQDCGGDGKSEVTATVHIYDNDIAKYGVCKEHEALPGDVLVQYRERELMSLIVLLREDRIAREDVKKKVEQIVNDLKSVDSINDVPARQSEIDRLGARLSAMTNDDQMDEKVHLENIKAELKKIRGRHPSKIDDEKKKAKDDVDVLLKLIDDLEDRMTLQCDRDIARAESRLRKKGNRLARTSISMEQVKENTDVYAIDKASIDLKTAENQTLLKDVKGVTPITYNDLFQAYDDYKQYFFKFYMGYEYATTVKDLLKKGVPRAGLAVQYRAWEHDVPDAKPSGFWDGFGFYGIHSTFQAMVTGSAEQDTVVSSPTASTLASSLTPTIKNTAENRALEGDADFFMPLYRTARFNNGKMWGYLGPVVSLGLKKVDNVVDSEGNIVDRYDRRHYAGIMLAFNPELYTEVLYGKTTSISSERLEIRAQLPVYKFNNESRLLLGGIANLGVKHRQPDETDVIRIYLTWNVNFENVYEYFSGQIINNSQ
jgi:hypothetical protein